MGAAPMKFQKKNGRQKMKKTMGSAAFLQIHFFRAHDPGIPTLIISRSTSHIFDSKFSSIFRKILKTRKTEIGNLKTWKVVQKKYVDFP